MDSYSFKKNNPSPLKNPPEEQKDMGKKLVPKTDVMSLSGVMYPYVSKNFYTTHKSLSN